MTRHEHPVAALPPNGEAPSFLDEKDFVAGTHRACAPEQTWARIYPMLSRAGITRVADVTWLDDTGIPVYQAIRPGARSLSVSQGKGITTAAAKVSACMEAIELFHAERIGLPSTRASIREMKDRLGYDVYDLLIADYSVINDDTVLDWLPAETLFTHVATYVPRSYVDMDCRFGASLVPPIFTATTNGLASGNTKLEAILHALYEVIERDRIASIGQPDEWVFVAEDSVEGEAAQLLSTVSVAGNRIELIDATGDGALPCIRAQAWSPLYPFRFIGSGCHCDRDVAACRAITEAVQGRLAVINGTRDDIDEDTWSLLTAVSETEYHPFPRGREISWSDIPSHRATSFIDDLATVKGNLSQWDEPIVVDLTLDEFKIDVVKVVVPKTRMSARE